MRVEFTSFYCVLPAVYRKIDKVQIGDVKHRFWSIKPTKQYICR